MEARLVHTGYARPFVQDLPFLEKGSGVLAEAWSTFPVVPLVPEGYGLTVIDRDTRWVGDVQGYSSPCRMNVLQIALALHERKQTVPAPLKWDDDAELFKDAWRAGALGNVLLTKSNRAESCVMPWADLAEQMGWKAGAPAKAFAWIRAASDKAKALAWIKKTSKKKEPSWRPESWSFHPPGWSIEKFEETGAGGSALAAAMIDRGFTFGPNLFNLWKAYAEQRERAPIDVSAMEAQRVARTLDGALPSAPTGRSSIRL